jgi:hypothetical protein
MSTTKELFNHENEKYQTLEFWEKQKDGMVYSYRDDSDWISKQLENMSEDEDEIKKWLWNPTSIGNLSFLALHAPEEEQRNKCIRIFNIAKKLLRN